MEKEYELLERADLQDEEVKRACALMEACMRSLKNTFSLLAMPLNVFQLVPVKNTLYAISTDGMRLYFNPQMVLTQYKRSGKFFLKRELAHIVLHGVLGHFEIWEEYRHRELISLVMDAQVERLMHFLKLSGGYDPEEDAYLEEFDFGSYYRALKDKCFFKRLRNISREVSSDQHELWMVKKRKLCLMGISGGEAGKEGRDSKGAPNAAGEDDSECMAKDLKAVWSQVREVLFGRDVKNSSLDVSEDCYRKLFNLFYSENAQFREVDRSEKCHTDYRELIKKIVSVDELAKERDNIDYALYQYGMSLYGDMPLIEPLECVEEKRLDNLVIAIDTSGSCDGKLVQQFLAGTVQILEDIGADTVFEGIYLLQCDDILRKEDCLTDIRQLPETFKNGYRLLGFGGTDFRPVFDRTAKLAEQGKRISALLYFSDGQGEFPDKKPDFETWFILPQDEEDSLDLFKENHIPDWVKVVTYESEGVS